MPDAWCRLSIFWVTKAGTLPARWRLASARWRRPGLAAAKLGSMAKRRSQDSSRISRRLRKSSNSIGRYLLHSPPGERKSGMPHSVEMPAPVKGTIRLEAAISSRRRSTALSRSAAIIVIMCAGRCPRFSHEVSTMRYLHTMLRVRNLDDALDFYVNKLGLKETRRRVDEKNKYTLVFLAAPGDLGRVEETKKEGRPGLEVELTYNWDSEDYGEARYFGHLAYEVDDIYAACERLMQAGVTINRPPRDGVMAFVRSPDKHSIELLQKGAAKPPQEPWKSMPNTGKW